MNLEKQDSSVSVDEPDTPYDNERPSSASVIGLGFRLLGTSDLKELLALFQTKHTVEKSRLKLNGDGAVDTDFFNIPPDEVYQCSPHFGSLLEVVAECIMNSGMTFKDVSRKRTGLYLHSNLTDSYRELTSRMAHTFSLTGPVIEFAGLDSSPSIALRTGLQDLKTGRCDLAIVAGICKQRSSHPGIRRLHDYDCCPHQGQSTEGLVAILISLDQTSLTRVYCEIDSSQSPASEERGTKECDFGMYQIFREKSGDLNEKEERKLSCSDKLYNLFKSSHPISALTGIITSISSMLSNNNCSKSNASPGKGKRNAKNKDNAVCLNEDQRVYGVYVSDCKGINYRIDVKEARNAESDVSSETPAQVAAIVPTTVHPLASIDKAEKVLKKYENVRGFLQFLTNSELSKGLNGPLQQLHYYLKIPERSQFCQFDFATIGEMPVIVVFEDFLISAWNPSPDLLNVPQVQRSISVIDKILLKADVPYSVMAILKSGNIPDCSTQGGIMTRVACQLAVVDVLTSVHSVDAIHTITATGLGSIPAAYADGAVTLTHAVKVAVTIETTLCSVTGNSENKVILDLFCSPDDVHQLGPWVEILCHYSNGLYRVTAPVDKRKAVLELIVSKGFAYKELSISIPVYSQAFRDSLNGLEKRLDSIFQVSTFWSSRVEILGVMNKNSKSRKCNPAFFVEVLCSPFDGELETKETAIGYCPKSCTDQTGPDETSLAKDISTKTNSPKQVPFTPKADRPQEKGEQLLLRQTEQKFISTPSKGDTSELVLNCSTNALKGSFLCAPESLSSVSEEVSGSITSPQPPQNSIQILQDAFTNKMNVNNVNENFLYLHFFSSFTNTISEDGSCSEKSASVGLNYSSSINSMCECDAEEPVHMYIRANQQGLLESLAWIHATGNRMEAEYQFPKDDDLRPMYCGDFDMLSLWTWHRESPSSLQHLSDARNLDKLSKENVTMYSLSSKPRLSDSLVQALINRRPLTQPPGNEEEAKTNQDRKIPCAFDSCLLLVSGYRWEHSVNRVVPAFGPNTPGGEELKMSKQVRFSYNNAGCVEEHQTGEETSSRHTGWTSMSAEEAEFLDESRYGFANCGDLLTALNEVRTDKFSFVSMLQIDESFEKYLTDIMFSFPVSSCLHVFITPTMYATSVSKYVINISRTDFPSPSGENLCVLLRDRSTDQSESCSSVTKALSIISSFEEELYSNYIARVFEFPKVIGFDLSFSCLEFMVFDKEKEVVRIAFFNSCHEELDMDSSTSSSSYTLEELMDCCDDNGNVVAPDDGSLCGFEQESTSKSRGNISPLLPTDCMNTNFCLNVDETFVKTLSRLTRINRHTIAYIQPKDYVETEERINNPYPTVNGGNNSRSNEGEDGTICENNLPQGAGLHHEDVSEKDKRRPKGTTDQSIYLLSITGSAELQIFLYNRSSFEITQWNSIDQVVKVLQYHHPDIQNSHEAYVTKFEEEEYLFETFIYAFFRPSYRNVTKIDKKNDNIEIHSNGLGLKDASPLTPKDGDTSQDSKQIHSGISNEIHGQGKDLAHTPSGASASRFVIPEIIISPPEEFEYQNQRVGKDITAQKISTAIFSTPLSEQRVLNVVASRDELPKMSTSIEIEEHVEKKLQSSHILGCEKEASISDCDAAINGIQTRENSIIKDGLDLLPPPIQSELNVPLNPNNEPVSLNYCNFVSDEKSSDSTKSLPSGNCTELGENYSNKENAVFSSEMESSDVFAMLNKPRTEEDEVLSKFKVTRALVMHLTDRISSFHEQKGRAVGNLLLYIAKEDVSDDSLQCKDRQTFLGLVLFDDMDVHHKRCPLPNSFDESNVESALNVWLAWYILRVLVKVNKQNGPRMDIVVQPPIQRDSASIMLVASGLGCGRVITSCSVAEMREDLEAMVRGSVVLDGGLDRLSVLPWVGREGVNAVVMLRQQELGDLLGLLAPSGSLVLCGEVDRTEEIQVSSLPHNGCITTFDPLSAVRYLCTMEDGEKTEFEKEFVSLLENVSELDEFYPSAKEGYFYQILGTVAPSCVEEQPLELAVHNIFLSTSCNWQETFQSIPPHQRRMVGEMHHLMSYLFGEELTAGMLDCLLP